MAGSTDFKRVLLKISGEVLMGDGDFGLDPKMVSRIAEDIAEVRKTGIELSLVVGGGNIFRGVSVAAQGMERTSADYMGMLATVMNALALQSALEALDVPTRVLSAIPMSTVCEPYIHRRAAHHLEKGRVVIFAAGTGNPYFTTDTAAALRASEMGCDCLMKGTKVDGVYSADPETDPDAVRYESLTHFDVLQRDLKVMDAAAVTLCRENDIPILVFSIQNAGEVNRVIHGDGQFTIVRGES
ncbi:MAG: UMP kinase [Alphaproteobacteria bacterium]|nr:UMP kinase [Alphaproteobacteria bacterium]